MEIIRLTTWIKAPVERCFRLATSPDIHQVLVSLSVSGILRPGPSPHLSEGDRLKWPGHYLGLLPTYTTRIAQMRQCGCFREVLETGGFRHFEHDHHFTPLNDGTRMRDEIRFVIPPGFLGPMTTPVVRRYLIWRISMGNSLFRHIAQSQLWRQYLKPAPLSQTDHVPPAEVTARNDGAEGVSRGQMTAN